MKGPTQEVRCDEVFLFDERERSDERKRRGRVEMGRENMEAELF
jgi:hypothetical protein